MERGKELEDWFDGKCLAYANGRTCVGKSGHPVGEHTWKGVMGMVHTVRTTHIQRLIKNALALADRADGAVAGTMIPLEDSHRPGQPEALVDHALAKAASDLRHAAEELEAERHSCYGWAQS